MINGNGAQTDYEGETHIPNFEGVLERFAPFTKLFVERKWEDFECEAESPQERYTLWKEWVVSVDKKVKQQLATPIDILIATDALSEGQNLQDADMVINYDIHWNPVRTIQRVGRIDRLGSPNQEVFTVNFWPAPNINEYLNLQTRIEKRMAAMKIIGSEDIKDFTEGKDLSRIKLKFHKNADFCSGEKDTTQYLFEDDESKESVWTILNSWRGNSKNKETSSLLDYCDYLITFSQYNLYGSDFYIFGGIYEIKKAFPEKYGKNGYDIKLLKDYKEYRKRLIVKFKTGRVFERWYLSLQDNDIEIFELFPDIASEKFNGYQNVSIVYKNLKIALNDPTWIGALKNVKAIYAITDISNGKLYIGSACGNTGLFGRWSDYINNLTGGNQEFEDIKKINGEDYIKKNFKYSILEIFDTKTKQEYILERENYWKNVFETKKFGMNWN